MTNSSLKNVHTFANFMDDLFLDYKKNDKMDSVTNDAPYPREGYCEKQKRTVFNVTFVKWAAEFAHFHGKSTEEEFPNFKLVSKELFRYEFVGFDGFFYFDQSLGQQIANKFKSEFFSSQNPMPKIVKNQILQLTLSLAARILLCVISNQIEMELFLEPMWNYARVIQIERNECKAALQAFDELRKIVHFAMNSPSENKETIMALTERREFTFLAKFLNGISRDSYYETRPKFEMFLREFGHKSFAEKTNSLRSLLALLDQIIADYKLCNEYDEMSANKRQLKLIYWKNEQLKFGAIIFEILKKRWANVQKRQEGTDAEGNPRWKIGISIGGGIDQNHRQSAYSDSGIYVTSVEANSPAEEAGLKVHDKILQVNGVDYTMITHERAVKYLKKESVLDLLVTRATPKHSTEVHM
ncbi:hypothetical protein niasHT_010473 [Heterodera trifolii]|uniref:PDZ domain-containing protein n=1 Tax=Heterodera trifolii TaxID=157864 RepID=A0ABD2MC70_9BILA